ncbi:MAG: exodeoxyribonuclease VII large subunit [Candidatus Manganitrophus sp.]|nr:MAG: exodeoxyribonuclease VII large subunit [Candidatus Manganitrophus sp.]
MIRGHLTLYEAKGEYQIIVDYIEPRGAGALQAAFEALKEKLRLEGLFDPGRKRPIPPLPGRIGLITSSTGAALQDLMKVLKRTELPISILIYPVAVQGEGAADEIARALDALNQRSRRSSAERIDLLILARGGGSLEDLWAFNEEIVARAIARSEIPVLSAVGHETDTTIADFVADLRAPTPSVAAEIVVRNAAEMLGRFYSLNAALVETIRARIQAERNHLQYEIRLLADPVRRIGQFHDRVDHLAIRLRQSFGRLLSERRAKLVRHQQGLTHLNPIDRLQALRRRLTELNLNLTQRGSDLILRRRRLLQSQMVQLNILSPLNILERGYSITRKVPSREVVREADAVALRDQIEITLHRGKLICSVEEKVTLDVPKKGDRGDSAEER